MTKSFFAGLKNCRNVFRLLILNKLPQHVGEDIDGLGNLTPGVRQRRRAIGHRRIESPEDVRHRVDEKNSFSRLSPVRGTLWWHYDFDHRVVISGCQFAVKSQRSFSSLRLATFLCAFA